MSTSHLPRIAFFRDHIVPAKRRKGWQPAGSRVCKSCALLGTGALALAVASPGEAIELLTASLRQGTVVNLHGADAEAEHTALALVFALPWQVSEGQAWRWQTGLDLTASTYSGATDTAAFSVGPVVGFRKRDSRFLFEAGAQLTYLSEAVLGTHDMGCRGHFTTHVAVFYDLGSRWGVGYRLQHISNASLCEVNPGINSHMAELRYRF